MISTTLVYIKEGRLKEDLHTSFHRTPFLLGGLDLRIVHTRKKKKKKKKKNRLLVEKGHR